MKEASLKNLAPTIIERKMIRRWVNFRGYINVEL